MIYKFLKQIIRLALFFFFRKIIVTGKEHIPKSGPLILVANHPNTLMDPLLIAAITEQRIGFVANAGIFINKIVSRIFNYFHVIPIFRKSDIEPGEKPDNSKSFKKCHEYLRGKGSLLIFPEGTSHYELRLREIKTGTARIALSFEELHRFKGGLKIVPIALDYSDAIQFRSMVSVTVCPAISISSFEDVYRKDEVAGVIGLTEVIRKELAEIIPQTSDKEQEMFLVQAHQFYSLYYSEKSNLNSSQSLELRNEVSKALRFLHLKNSQFYLDMKQKLYLFYELLKAYKLSPYVIPPDDTKHRSYFFEVLIVIKFIVLFPFYLMGLVANYLPYILVAKIFNKLKLDIEYKAPVQMITGMLIFPAYYALILWIFSNYVSQDVWHAIALLCMMPVTGYICLYFYTQFRRFLKSLRFDFYLATDKKKTLLDLQSEIIIDLKKARKMYLKNEVG